MTPLHSAAENGNLLIVKFLAEHVNDIDLRTDIFWDMRTPLHKAAALGHLEVVKFLIEKGADPSIKSASGKSPYDYSVEEKQWDVVLFLERFANRRFS